MEEGTAFIGDADLSYSVYLSSGRDDQPIYKPNDLSVGGQLRFGLPVLDELRIGLSGYTGRVNTRLRSMIMDYEGIEYIDDILFLYRENIIGGDIRLSINPLTIQAEVNYSRSTDYMNDDSTFGTLGTYVLGSVDILKKENVSVTPYAFYEYVKYIDPLNNPTIDPMMVSDGYHKFMGGINFRAFTNYGIKLEYNFTRLLLGDDPDKLNDISGIASQFYIAF
ncbi:MAG: hypothetical protein GXY77_14365 [Fibrobacter sp.]|nr:hypothetical protein [Fibrobacter sp.]